MRWPIQLYYYCCCCSYPSKLLFVDGRAQFLWDSYSNEHYSERSDSIDLYGTQECIIYLSATTAPPWVRTYHEEDCGGQVNSSVQNRSTRRPYNIIPFSETHYTPILRKIVSCSPISGWMGEKQEEKEGSTASL